jgi:hypothetical protein
VFVGDRVVLVHNLEILVSLTVFARDRTVLVHDKEYMVSFPRFLKIVLS